LANRPRRSSSGRTLADKLDHLFRTIHPRNRGEYSYDEVAQAIQETGVTISGTYIWMLRTGRRDNPTKRHLAALAQFFGVSPMYFFDDEQAAKIDAELDLLAALRDAGVRRIALRASALQPNLQAAVGELIDRLLEHQGLPPGEQPPPDPGHSAEPDDAPRGPHGSPYA
jgi:transcriptional regulator with XRE-family HTH domain